VRHVRNQRLTSSDLLKKYEYQYQQRLRRESEEEEYERRTGKCLKKHEDVSDHWHCPFFRYCWDSGMSQLPTTRDCPECGPVKPDAKGVSIFGRLGPVPTQQEQVRSPQRRVNFEEEEDKYHRLRWCPDELNRSQKHRVQRLHSLEEAEARYLKSLRKARPDLADKVHHVQKRESCPPRKEWRPKSTRADVRTSADTHMVFVLPAEFHARPHEESVAQFDLGPRPVIFEKPQAKNYKHLKALYLKGYINGQPINKMLVDTGAAVNIMSYSVLRHLGRSTGDLIKTNVTLSDFNR
jgi:rubredoxin